MIETQACGILGSGQANVVVLCRVRPAVKEAADPPGLREQVVVLFDEWGRLSEDQPANQMHDKFVLKLQTAGFLKVTLPCLAAYTASPKCPPGPCHAPPQET